LPQQGQFTRVLADGITLADGIRIPLVDGIILPAPLRRRLRVKIFRDVHGIRRGGRDLRGFCGCPACFLRGFEIFAHVDKSPNRRFLYVVGNDFFKTFAEYVDKIFLISKS
jgi:hypothetical protein